MRAALLLVAAAAVLQMSVGVGAAEKAGAAAEKTGAAEKAGAAAEKTGAAEEAGAPVVSLRAGQVLGTTTTTFSRTVYAFKGIPYAKPPVGKRRFKDPEYLKYWVGTWNATRAPSSCLQFTRMPLSSVEGDEDCLYLSVYTPTLNPSAGLLPVIVYFHGGGFMYGASKFVAPTSLLEHDVVLVTLNYRLGPLGFLSTGDDIIPGNAGLKDQTMALWWVRENIAAFGGDPFKVMITGNSAGGAAVHLHYLTPLSTGLFSRGISMSGSALCPWTQTERAPEKATQLAELLGCPTTTTRDMAVCLRHRPARAIVELVAAFQDWKELPFAPFGPVVEPPGINRFMDKAPIDVITSGQAQNLPWMTGVTTEEGLYTTSEYVGEPETMRHLQENWSQLAPLLLDVKDTTADPAAVCNQALTKYFAGVPIQDASDKLIQLVGDRLFKADVVEAATAMAAAGNPAVHLYQYANRAQRSYSQFYSGDTTDWGVAHADDMLLLLFNETELKSLSEQDKASSQALAKIWVDYATNGTVSWPTVDEKPGSITLTQIQQNIQLLTKTVTDFGNREFWKSLPIQENVRNVDAVRDEL